MTGTNDFLQAIEHNCKGYIVSTGCRGTVCQYADSPDDVEHFCEASFGVYGCDSCGSNLAGDRLPGTMIPLNYKAGEDTMIDIELCIDCVLFWANGDLPDNWN